MKKWLCILIAMTIIAALPLVSLADDDICPETGGAHDWALNRTDKAPTLTETGWGRYVCLQCKNYKEDVIPKRDPQVTYTLYGGTNHPDNPKTFPNGTTLTLKDPTHPSGYVFCGWYTDTTFKTRVYTLQQNNDRPDYPYLNVYALWKPPVTTESRTVCPGKSWEFTYTLFTTSELSGKSAATSTDPSVLAAALDTSTGTVASQYVYDRGILVGINNFFNLVMDSKQEGTATVNLSNKGIVLYSFEYTVAHDWSDWETVTEATNTADGLRKHTCAECGAEEEEVIPKLAATISYQMNGGTNDAANPTLVLIGKTVTLKEPTRKGYTFEGWCTDSALTKVITTITGTADMTVYAKWKANQYSVAFNGNGSTSGSMKALSMKYDTAKALTANAFKCKGYDFKGWNTKKDGSGTSYADKASVKNLTATDGATSTLYAQWKAHSYKVTFDGNGSTSGSMKALDMKYGTAKALTANAFKREGYKFTGWNTKKDGSGTSYADKASVKNLTAADGETVKLFAQWKAISYSVSFNGNGSTSGSMKPLAMKYDTAKKLTANAFKRTGYKFAGWNTKKDGKGTAYADKASVKNLTVKDGDTVKLYAQWKGISYSIVFKGNGSTSGSMKALDMQYGKAKALTANAFKRTGYKFAGWNTKKDGSGKAYTNKESVKNLVTKNGTTVTLYAQWKKK